MQTSLSRKFVTQQPTLLNAYLRYNYNNFVITRSIRAPCWYCLRRHRLFFVLRIDVRKQNILPFLILIIMLGNSHHRNATFFKISNKFIVFALNLNVLRKSFILIIKEKWISFEMFTNIVNKHPFYAMCTT